MSAPIYYQGADENAVVANTTFVNGSGVATTPTTVSCLVTDPTGAQVTHTYQGTAPADITLVSTGSFQLLVPCATAGLWSFVWSASGNGVSDVQGGTFTVQPVALSQFYCSVEELKDRLRITDTQDDMSLELAVQGASNWVNNHCGRYFYQLAETRTFIPEDLYTLQLPDLVSVTAFAVDRDGDGVYEETWVQGSDYDLLEALTEYNQNVSGEPRPYRVARVATASGAGGRFFPFVWPFSHLNRVQIQGVWGWPAVPYAVKQAALQLAADLFKRKDSPFGVVGTPDTGVIRVGKADPQILSLLAPYRDSKRKVGV